MDPRLRVISIWGHSKPKEILTSVQRSHRNLVKGTLGPLWVKAERGEKSPPKVSHSTLVFLPSGGASYDWDMVTASCRTLSRPLPAQPPLVLNSLLRSLRASHSYSHFPEASAAHSVSAVPNGEGGLVFQTRNIQTWINNLPVTLNKYCPQRGKSLPLWNKKSAQLPPYFRK